MIRYVIPLMLVLVCRGATLAQDASPHRQIILLKFDDVVSNSRPGGGPVPPRWQRLADYLAANHIKGSFGVICQSLEQDNPAYFDWIKNIQKGGLIEIWMHGYHLKKNALEPGEFEHGAAEEQRAILEKSEKLAKEKLGFPLPAFGQHWSGTTAATDEALALIPEIKIWLYGWAKPRYFKGLSLERIMALENPTFDPNPEKFEEIYNQVGVGKPVLLLQGHPNMWDDKHWEGFLKIVEFLKSKDVVFMTPSEYAASVGK